MPHELSTYRIYVCSSPLTSFRNVNFLLTSLLVTLLSEEWKRSEYLIMFALDENRCPVKHSIGVSYPLHSFAFQGAKSGVQDYISLGVDVNCRDEQGRTPLHEACCNNQCALSDVYMEIVKLLVINGADHCALDKLEETPLHCIARHRVSRNIAAYLVLECKVPITCLNLYGQTPLDVAKESCFSVYQRYNLKLDQLTPKHHNFSSFSPVLQFLILEENRSNLSLRQLAKQQVYDCLRPYENEKVDQLPIPSRLKCYVGGIVFIEWLKHREEVNTKKTRVKVRAETKKCSIL
ncbi:Engineered Protein [Oopsacas minuta]|uniref:Engineered Protein n=1 Tax=Oopsacas minuta TaxID=111878 RepID=A0AAV7JCI2_9METZ|nr:Engineered Protein [Oopsacas minuta]